MTFTLIICFFCGCCCFIEFCIIATEQNFVFMLYFDIP